MSKTIKSKQDVRELDAPSPTGNYITTPALITTQEKPELPMISTEQAIQDVDDLEDMFSGEGTTESSILKELFNAKNIKVKTRLSADNVSVVSRLYLMAKITKRPYLHTILDEYITLMVSLDGKSRAEFVEAHKDRNQQQSGFFGNIGNMMRGKTL